MKQLILLIYIMIGLQSFSQSWEKLNDSIFKIELRKISTSQTDLNYELNYQRIIYKNENESIPYLNQKGIFVRGEGKEYYTQLMENIQIQTNDFKLAIDTVKKMILILKPDTLFNAINLDQIFSSIETNKYEFEQLKSKIEISMRITEKQKVSSNQITEIVYDAKTKAIKRIVLKFWKQNYFSESLNDQSEEQPRVEMIYSPFKSLTAKEVQFKFSVDQWVLIENGKMKLATLKSGSYTLEDLRNTKNN